METSEKKETNGETNNKNIVKQETYVEIEVKIIQEYETKLENLKQEMIDIYYSIPGYRELYSRTNKSEAIELLLKIDKKLKQCLEEYNIELDKGRDYNSNNNNDNSNNDNSNDET